MKTTNHILQPEQYRPVVESALWGQQKNPRWIFYPDLHLLLGWGDGIWETLGEKLSGVKYCFNLSADLETVVAIESFRAWHTDYHKNAANRPTLSIYYNNHCRHKCDDHVLDFESMYRVQHLVLMRMEFDPIPCCSLEVRTKVLKPEHRLVMEKFGLVYEPGTGRIRLGGGERRDRNELEQRWATYVSRIKAEYVEKRATALLADPSCRPPQFALARQKMIRSRAGEIERGKKNGQGLPHIEYTKEELDRGAAHGIARKEATDSMCDFSWKHVCYYTNHWVSVLSTDEERARDSASTSHP